MHFYGPANDRHGTIALRNLVQDVLQDVPPPTASTTASTTWARTYSSPCRAHYIVNGQAKLPGQGFPDRAQPAWRKILRRVATVLNATFGM